MFKRLIRSLAMPFLTGVLIACAFFAGRIHALHVTYAHIAEYERRLQELADRAGRDADRSKAAADRSEAQAEDSEKNLDETEKSIEDVRVLKDRLERNLKKLPDMIRHCVEDKLNEESFPELPPRPTNL
jgi:hypothetical protein